MRLPLKSFGLTTLVFAALVGVGPARADTLPTFLPLIYEGNNGNYLLLQCNKNFPIPLSPCDATPPDTFSWQTNANTEWNIDPVTFKAYGSKYIDQQNIQRFSVIDLETGDYEETTWFNVVSGLANPGPLYGNKWAEKYGEIEGGYNIEQLDADVKVNASDISNNASEIQTNSSDISTNKSAIEANKEEIYVNGDVISSNIFDIKANASNISTNKSDISTNKSAIEANKEEIYVNGDVISSNIFDIKANASNISANKSDISINKSAIEANKEEIKANASGITTNASAILDNASNVSSNKANIEANAFNISENKSQIEVNDIDIASLMDKIDNPNKVQVKDNGFSVGGENLIEINDGVTSIGENSIKFQEVDGVEQMWAEDKADNFIDINISKGSDLLINGRSVQGQIDDNRTASNSNRNNINSLGEGVAASTALSSAMTALPTVSADSQLTCGVGTGTYSGATAVALGCASKVNDRLSFNIGGSKMLQGSSNYEYGSGSLDSFAARAGLVMRLGKLHKPNATGEELQARLQQVEAENLKISNESAAIRAENQVINEKNAELNAKYSSIVQQNELIQQQNKQLMARLERLEAIALGIQPKTDELAVVPGAIAK